MAVVGIDFGTATSSIAVFRDGEPVVIPNERGESSTPSVVFFGEDGEITVGTPALERAADRPERAVFSAKRHLGTGWYEEIDGKICTAADAAALILTKLRKDAERFLGTDISQAVIGIPAYFDSIRRDALRHATRRAGLQILKWLIETNAIGLLYEFNEPHKEPLLATACSFDDGSFDISILEMGDSVVEVRAVGGMSAPVGEDIAWSCRRAVEDAMVRLDDIKVILLKEAENVPLARQTICDFFKNEPQQGTDTDHAVALGAAIQGGIFAGDVDNLLPLRVTPLTFEASIKGGKSESVIGRNTTIPTRKTATFATVRDGQTAVEVEVWEGRGEISVEGTKIGRVFLDGIAPARKGEMSIEVTLDIDDNGVVHASAKGETTLKEVSSRMKTCFYPSEYRSILTRAAVARIGRQGKKIPEKLAATILEDLGEHIEMWAREEGRDLRKGLQGASPWNQLGDRMSYRYRKMSSFSGDMEGIFRLVIFTVGEIVEEEEEKGISPLHLLTVFDHI